MNELKIFESAEFGQIRTVTINNEPYFVGRDVADILGYSNPQKAIRDHVDNEDKTLNESFTVNGTMGVLINESGLYSLILSSKMPNARTFKRWVTSDVLPMIRKHGVYAVDELLNDPDLAIKAFTALKEEKELNKKLTNEVNVKSKLIEELKPMADYMDRILKNPGLVTITQIAKDYGMSGQEMNAVLHNIKVQYKQSSQWLLYRNYQDQGYTHSETIDIEHTDGRRDVKMNTKWTQKGRLFLYQLLKDNGIYPTIEKEGK